ncbi:asparagine synthase (glutamine-hydrolysing) [Pedococcus cremeus]|uniref:asparagine synthase (glutamine-hydrolyzing) n=1 Tax=Pedococcus cremeus TaxID=587636 RepID=A0A1H9XUM1_9MICO|nr:asparagine synthase (glutamine-hydrolyzing) [Pedococcus cremeus]SES49870.1 asparagine synthase (glutamine-hydrolysing) [Pedococcus cremeus]
MCGVAGAYQQPDGKVLVGTMVDRLEHRGPDAGGVVELVDPDTSVVLGHRRLSIIDLSTAADQPFAKDGLTLSYNGEIYNFLQIRRELEALGVRFATRSDTEVVLEAWRVWGTASLRRFRGMFAFAVHDARTGSLTLVRDPLGIKPLYVMPRGSGVVFASELKAILTVVGPELKVDPAAMVASTLYYWLPQEFNAVQGVHKLAPGSWRTYHRDGSVSEGRYWDTAEEAARAAAGPRADLREVLEASVQAHLVSDAPVASFLSGGLDSSIVTALAHRADAAIEAYTIAFRAQDQRLEAMPDDARYARMMASHLGIRLHEIEISPNVVDLLPRMVDILDEPIGDPAAINTLLMCDAAREAGVKVLLSGMGADELFGGYRKHLATLITARYRRLPRAVRTGVVAPAVRAMPVAVGQRGIRTVRWAQRFLTFAELPEEEAFRRSYTLYDRDELVDLLDPALTGDVDHVIDSHRAVYEDTTLTDQVDRMCLADTRMFMVGLNLTYTDRASMAASTEVRVPFVDPVVFAAAFSLPGSEKIRGRVQKAALKDAARAWLPDEVIDRPKASFGVPLRAWVTNDLRELVDDTLLRGELVGTGFLQREPLERLVADQRSGRRDESKQIWQLLCLEQWYRTVQAAGVGTA